MRGPRRARAWPSGDVVNTAARLQTAAPVERDPRRRDHLPGDRARDRLRRGTSRSQAKGKAEPMRGLGGQRARARVGVDARRTAHAAGRSRAGARLCCGRRSRACSARAGAAARDAGRRARASARAGSSTSSCRRSSRATGLVFWRQGRSLPYGEGVTLLGARRDGQGAGRNPRVGRRREEAADEARAARWRRFVADAADIAWVERHLRPLVGLDTEDIGRRQGATRRSPPGGASSRRSPSERPLVLVFEDLHWADDALLDFIDHLVDWASRRAGARASTRPGRSCSSRRPGWGGGKANSSTHPAVARSPNDETAALLQRPARAAPSLDADIAGTPARAGRRQPALRRGVRADADRAARVDDRRCPRRSRASSPPASTRCPREEKELLQDAAVIGRVFWLGALGGERWRLEETAARPRAQASSSAGSAASAVAGETRVRVPPRARPRGGLRADPARAARDDKHRRAAEWIESLGRLEDHAEMLAHHYAAALDYARASGQDPGPLAEQGRVALREAGDRAFGLNAFASGRPLLRARGRVLATGRPERPELLLKLARAHHASADTERGEMRWKLLVKLRSLPDGRAGGRGRLAARGGLVVSRRSGPAVGTPGASA